MIRGRRDDIDFAGQHGYHVLELTRIIGAIRIDRADDISRCLANASHDRARDASIGGVTYDPTVTPVTECQAESFARVI
jgi:hypothetical protein